MAGYTRQSIADIINGLDVTAPPINAEFNRMQEAFDASSGHSHDGLTGNAPPVPLSTSVSGYLPSANGGVGGKNNTTATVAPAVSNDATQGYAAGSLWLNTTTDRVYNCASNGTGAAVWSEAAQITASGIFFPATNDTVDLGTTAKRFKNAYLSGNITAAGDVAVGGTHTVSGATSLQALTATSSIISGLSQLASVDINSGNIDATAIGASTPSTAVVTTLVANTGITGSLTGDVAGDVVGNLTGNVTAATGTTTLNNLTINGTTDFTNTTLANIANPNFDTDAASKGYVDTAVSNLIESAPGTMDTLNELAAALGDDPDFATTIATDIATKLPKAGGTMSGSITMAGNTVTGLGTPSVSSDAVPLQYVTALYGSTSDAATSASNAATSETNAATTYASFADRYLGVKSSAPSLGNDGDALNTGALYFNTTVDIMYVYGGSGWQSAGSSVNGTAGRHVYTATADQTTFSVTYDPGYVDVYLNGVKLIVSTDFTATSGTNVVLSTGATAGDSVDIIAYGTFVVADTYTKAQSDALYETIDETILQDSDIGVTVQAYDATLVVDADIGVTVAPLASPALTGTPTAPTANTGTNTTQIATTAFVAALVVDPTLNSFQRATAISDTFTVQYAKTTTDAGVVSMYKEVASADETDNVFSATAASTAFEFDATKLAFTGGSLGLKVLSNTGYAIGSASYDSVSFSVASEDATPLGVVFNTDGTKMFMLGGSSDSVHQYTLTTGYDLSTASYDSVSFSVASEDTAVYGIAFNTDGTKMYMMGNQNDSVYQYTLTTGFDLSTASYDSVSFSVATEDVTPLGIAFNTDGTKMFILGYNNDTVFQYTLSTGFDLSTASYDSVSFSVATEEATPRELAFNTTGTKMFIVGPASSTVFQYTLSTGFDLSTASYESVSFSVASQDAATYVIAFNTDGTKMYMMGGTSKAVYQYSTVGNTYTANEYLPAITSNPLDTEFWTTLTSITASGTTNGQSAFYAFSSDSRASWLIMEDGGTAERTIARNNAGTWEYNSNVTYGSETWVSASVNTESDALSDAMSVSVNRMGGGFGLSSYDITGASYDSVSFSVTSQDTNPVGLSFSTDGTKMFVLGSTNDSVFQYTLTTGFDPSTASYDSVSFSVSSQEANPLCIAFSTDGTKMFIAGYVNKTVYQYTLSTAFDLSTASYASSSFSVTAQDIEPQGIAFNTDGTKMFMAGQNNDTVYQYTLSTGFDLSTASYDSVSFSVAAQDDRLYGIEFNAVGTKMFIVGDTNDSIFQYTLTTANDLSTASYDSVSFSVASQDGSPRDITFNTDGTKMVMMGVTNDSVYQYSTGGSPTYTALADSLSEAVILHTTDTSVTPSYTRTAIVYDANAQYTLLAPVTDYDVKLGTNKATITSKVAGNIKGRIV
jgi:hypothetical protein